MMRTLLILALPCLIISGGRSETLPAAVDQHRTTLARHADGSWHLLCDGAPFEVRGVGRETNTDLALACDVNTLRTYFSDPAPDAVAATRKKMDESFARGLRYIRGIALHREGTGFSYGNPADLERQRDRVRAIVRAYRDHPALLLWGLGNETEGSRTKEVHPEFWKELDVLARIVKEEDPAHPVMPVIAGASAWKVKAVEDYCPDIDILGVNTYGGAASLPRTLDEAGWGKPFLLTEFGPRGHWEVPRTPWGAPVEPGSEAKAALYARGYLGARDDPRGRFLGAVCFVWAQKQEITGTWYGMFLATGEKTPAVDAIAHVYSGRWPANRSPRIVKLNTDLALKEVPPGATFSASVEADDPENDTLSCEWKVIRESGQKWAEGAGERVPPTIDGCILGDASARAAPMVTVRVPEKPGAYRLFVFVRDGKGGGAAQNVPFLVQAASTRSATP